MVKEGFIKECGRMEDSMGEEYILGLKELKKKESGKMGKERNGNY